MPRWWSSYSTELGALIAQQLWSQLFPMLQGRSLRQLAWGAEASKKPVLRKAGEINLKGKLLQRAGRGRDPSAEPEPACVSITPPQSSQRCPADPQALAPPKHLTHYLVKLIIFCTVSSLCPSSQLTASLKTDVVAPLGPAEARACVLTAPTSTGSQDRPAESWLRAASHTPGALQDRPGHQEAVCSFQIIRSNLSSFPAEQRPETGMCRAGVQGGERLQARDIIWHHPFLPDFQLQDNGDNCSVAELSGLLRPYGAASWKMGLLVQS